MKKKAAAAATQATEGPRMPDVRIAYFPATPSATSEIQEWAREKGARILAVVPVHWEDLENVQA